jgi:hypothetical protein
MRLAESRGRKRDLRIEAAYYDKLMERLR